MSIREALFYQREAYPNLQGQFSPRSNTTGWVDLTGRGNHATHENNPGRSNWINGIYMDSTFDGLTAGGEVPIIKRSKKLYIGLELIASASVSGTVASWNNITTGESISVFVEMDNPSLAVLVYYRDGVGPPKLLSAFQNVTLDSKVWVDIKLNINPSEIGAEIYYDGSLVSSPDVSVSLPSGFQFENFSLGYYYASGSKTNRFSGNLSGLTWGLNHPNAAKLTQFHNILTGVSNYLPPKSTETLAYELVGVTPISKPGYMSGAVLMDEIGAIDWVHENCSVVENPSADGHRLSALRLNLSAALWSVPMNELDLGTGEFGMYGCYKLHVGLSGSEDFFKIYGINAYNDALIQRISANERGIFRTFEDGNHQNKSVGSGSDWVIQGDRQVFSCAINRVDKKIAHVGPTANSGSLTDITLDFNDTFGDGWFQSPDGSDYTLSSFGFFRFYLDDPEHIAIHDTQAKNYVEASSLLQRVADKRATARTGDVATVRMM